MNPGISVNDYTYSFSSAQAEPEGRWKNRRSENRMIMPSSENQAGGNVV
jgi:hypothetical protein